MKIPKNAKRVFQGVLFSVYQWRQKLFDGSYATFEIIGRKPSVDVIALVGGRIMVLMQEQPTKPLFPSLPGGRVGEREEPEDAARRELREETGHEAEKLRLFDTFTGVSKIYFPEYLYVAYGCKKVAEQQLDGGERITATFVSFDEFLQLCRNGRFTAPLALKFRMYEALVDPNKKRVLKEKIFSA